MNVAMPKGAMRILPGELPSDLYFFVAPTGYSPPSSSSTLYLYTDNTLMYTSFFADYGPLDLGFTFRFCREMETLMAEATKGKKSIVYYCIEDEGGHHRSNSAVLLCAYLIFVMKFSAEKAYEPFFGINPPFTPFRDAAFATNTWPLFVMDCCLGFYRAREGGHFDYGTFDLNKFLYMQALHNGDMSWVIEGKLLAFSGPLAKRRELASGEFTFTPEDYVPAFKKLGVTCVVRFNNKCYDRMIFERNGIRHCDLFYEDGGNPTEDILQAFLRLCETQPGAIAVHCKAGLGRTGTNIVAYMVKHLGFSVREAVAWHRVCRPGAIVGPQQQYLCSIEDKLKAEGKSFRERKGLEKSAKGSRQGRGQGDEIVSASMVTPTLGGSRPPSTSKQDGQEGVLPRQLGGTPRLSSRGSSRGSAKRSSDRTSASRAARTATATSNTATVSTKLKGLSISGSGGG